MCKRPFSKNAQFAHTHTVSLTGCSHNWLNSVASLLSLSLFFYYICIWLWADLVWTLTHLKTFLHITVKDSETCDFLWRHSSLFWTAASESRGPHTKAVERSSSVDGWGNVLWHFDPQFLLLLFSLFRSCRMSTSTGRRRMLCRRLLNTSECGRHLKGICCRSRFTWRSHILTIDRFIIIDHVLQNSRFKLTFTAPPLPR